jgi:ABC-type sugar transport system substrate-binding protein
MMNTSQKMLTKTKMALAAALTLAAASAAMANERDDDRGGYVVPGSMEGVNPVYHPGIFGDAAAAAKAYGFVASPTRKHPRTNAPKAVR